MSNQVALFEGISQLPAHLQGYEVDEATKKLAGGAGGLRISIKGGVWRLLDGGEEIGRNEDRALNVVIVASSPDTSRTYYEGEFVEGENKPPSCWSSDGKVPDADVKDKQSATCAMCPQNVAGSGTRGDSRACRYSRALAVTLANDIGGKVFKMQMPAQSIFGKPENGVVPLQAYAKQLVAHKVGVSAVVTELRFDTTSATPKVGFKPVRFLTKEEFELAKEQGASPEAQEAIKTSVFAQDGGEASAPLQIAGTNPAADSQPAQAAAAEPVTMGNTATVAATPPKRARAKPAPAATSTAPAQQADTAPSPAPQDAPAATDEDEEEAALLAALAAKRAAKAAAAEAAKAATVEPVVVKQQVAQAAPVPSAANAVLSAWDTEDDE